jgi:hypothetical protein
MAYRTNPFLERMSERTTSDQIFVRRFSPMILERLHDDAFEGGVHFFRSPPGGGKTTLLRAFTPAALHAFWSSRRIDDLNEAYRSLFARGIIEDKGGPKLLGVLLSCASGYADLPPGITNAQEGLFRALLDCRVVLRTLRSLAVLRGYGSHESLEAVTLEYGDDSLDLTEIPRCCSALELVAWAEERERVVYSRLDSIAGSSHAEMPIHVRNEGVLWLQSVRFVADGEEVAPKRLLMIDDMHKLRRKQRELLKRELTEVRPTIPVWLAERTIALGPSLLSQGVREGRELRDYSLGDMWDSSSGKRLFMAFAKSILDRRLDSQNQLPTGATFSQYLQPQIVASDVQGRIEKGLASFEVEMARHRSNSRYSEWLARARELMSNGDLESLQELYITRVLLARDEGRRQLMFDFGPLSANDLEKKDNSQVKGAAEIFMNHDLGIPYYFGMDRLCTMATFNVEELLSLAAELYDALLGKQMLRKRTLILSPREQEKLIRKVARARRDFIPKSHTEGARAQHLLDAIGAYCRERTFLPNAPYAPGVTGVRLSKSTGMVLLPDAPSSSASIRLLARVLSECVAENLLIVRSSAASTSREGGTIYYLNRMLCAHYGLPLQMGGWQDVTVSRMTDWMERGPSRQRQTSLEMG